MCHQSCLDFGKRIIESEIKDLDVLEVGSYDVNGSLRNIITRFKPSTYTGVDISNGPGVDVVCDARDIIHEFGEENFDFVISTELLEHAEDWKEVIHNIKTVCKEGGIILITTRSFGFPFHAYPNDFWRYEIEDMKKIFSDCEILILEKDPQVPGVFIKVRKPIDFVENALNIDLYSMQTGRRQ